MLNSVSIDLSAVLVRCPAGQDIMHDTPMPFGASKMDHSMAVLQRHILRLAVITQRSELYRSNSAHVEATSLDKVLHHGREAPGGCVVQCGAGVLHGHHVSTIRQGSEFSAVSKYRKIHNIGSYAMQLHHTRNQIDKSLRACQMQRVLGALYYNASQQ